MTGPVRQAGRVSRIGRLGVIGFAMAAVAPLLGIAGCGSSTPPAATTPTVARTTDTFSGTVAVGGDDFHGFPIAAAGTVDVTLTAATPPATIVMGVSVGVPADGKCTALAGGSTQTPAGTSVQLSGIASPGTLCVDVHDAGGQSAPVTYTVTVTHP
jgi:hypothetical protein